MFWTDTNRLAEDIQEKSEKLNTVVHAVQEVGTSVQQFNTSTCCLLYGCIKLLDGSSHFLDSMDNRI
jgi:hypothetical protein